MNKVIIFFFLLFFTSQLNSSEIDKQKFLSCNNFISEDYLRNYQNYEIEKIEIDILNYRNWTVNNIKIITSNTRFINNEFKESLKQMLLSHIKMALNVV